MSKATSYAAVFVVAFLVGGFSFRMVGLAEDGKTGLKPAGLPEVAPGANTPGPREFAIEGMQCEGCGRRLPRR